jgi:hypothetical protein
MQAFIQNYRLMIELISGVTLPQLHFQETAGNIHERERAIRMHQNHRIMLHFYAVAFTAYTKYAQTINRAINPRFLPAEMVVVVDVED